MGWETKVNRGDPYFSKSSTFSNEEDARNWVKQILSSQGVIASKVAGYCRNCSGRGRLINGDTCPDCKGTGKDDNPEAEAKTAEYTVEVGDKVRVNFSTWSEGYNPDAAKYQGSVGTVVEEFEMGGALVEFEDGYRQTFDPQEMQLVDYGKQAKIACTEHDYDENGKCKNCGKQKEGSKVAGLGIGEPVTILSVDMEGLVGRDPHPPASAEGHTGVITGDMVEHIVTGKQIGRAHV